MKMFNSVPESPFISSKSSFALYLSVDFQDKNVDFFDTVDSFLS